MKLKDRILELLYPTRCTFCHRLAQAGEKVCPHCRERLPYTKGAAKQELSKSLACCSPLYYTGDVRRSLLRYKFGGVRMYAEVYEEFLSKCIDENEISCDIITWVPLSRQRLRRRGYDQARLLAKAVAARQGIPLVPTLWKQRNNPAQSKTGGAERRRRNVKGAYELLPGTTLSGKCVLLVDDIVTTGATLSECAAVLKKAGAERVSALTVARRKD